MTPVLCVSTIRDEADNDAMHAMSRLEARQAVTVMKLHLSRRRRSPIWRRRVRTRCRRPRDCCNAARGRRRGIPFLVEELLAAAATNGALVQRGDRQEVAAPLSCVVPDSFCVSVRQRLHGMGPDGRRFLGAGALLGRRFNWRLAATAAECDPEVTEAVLARAVSMQLLAVQDGGFGFRHALTRDAMLDVLLPNERVMLANRCLAALELDATHPDQWRHLAADLAEAAGLADLRRAIRLKRARPPWSRCARHGSRGVATRREHRGRPLRPRRRPGEARRCSLRGRRCQTDPGRGGDVAGVAGHNRSTPLPQRQRTPHAGALAVTVTHFEVAGEELARARRLAADAGDEALAARVAAVAAQLAVAEGHSSEAEGLAVRAAGSALATHQPEVICEALEVASRCARTRDLDEAKDIGERALQVAEYFGLAYGGCEPSTSSALSRCSGQAASKSSNERAMNGTPGSGCNRHEPDLEIGAGLEVISGSPRPATRARAASRWRNCWNSVPWPRWRMHSSASSRPGRGLVVAWSRVHPESDIGW